MSRSALPFAGVREPDLFDLDPALDSSRVAGAQRAEKPMSPAECRGRVHSDPRCRLPDTQALLQAACILGPVRQSLGVVGGCACEIAERSLTGSTAVSLAGAERAPPLHAPAIAAGAAKPESEPRRSELREQRDEVRWRGLEIAFHASSMVRPPGRNNGSMRTNNLREQSRRRNRRNTRPAAPSAQRPGPVGRPPSFHSGFGPSASIRTAWTAARMTAAMWPGSVRSVSSVTRW